MVKLHVLLGFAALVAIVHGQEGPTNATIAPTTPTNGTDAPTVTETVPPTEEPHRLGDADRLALQAIHDRMNGDQWVRPWTFDDDLCDESTINCASANGIAWVNRLVLSDPNLEGEFPMSEILPGLQRMTELHIVDCPKLTAQLPPEFGQFHSLYELDIENTNLTGPIPPELFSDELRVTLRTLILVANPNLNGPIPNEIGRANRLIELQMHNNDLSGPIPEGMDELNSLEDLNLSHNNLTGPIPTFFSKENPQLKTLYLTQNNFDCPVPNYRFWARDGDLYVPLDVSRCTPNDAAVITEPSTGGIPTSTIAAVAAVAVGFVIACAIMTFFWWSKRKLEEAARQRRAPNDPTLNVRFAEVNEDDEV